MSDSPPFPSASDAPDEHARRDGAAGVAREPSEALLAYTAAHDHLQRLTARTDERLSDLQADAETIRQQRETHAETKARLNELEQEHTKTEERLTTVETQLEATEEAQAAEKAKGSVFYAILYSFAGLFFIAGDVIMSREIVANALKLRGDVEPWIFAIGLAMLAILLKPAYDRLVEAPYWNGRKGIFATVIGVCGAGALATLWILGAFRSTAFVSNARIQRLTAELMQASDPEAIGAIQAEIGTIQQGLIESPLGYWAFVVSGVLFAVAGAVCLGIGVRHGRDAYHVRYRLHRAAQRFSEQRDRLTDRMDSLQHRMAETRVALTRQRQVLDDRPSLEAIEKEMQTLREKQALLHDRQADLHGRQLQARYRRHYAHGQARRAASSSQAGDGVADPPGASLPSDSFASSPDTPTTDAGARRPHEALRDLLLNRDTTG